MKFPNFNKSIKNLMPINKNFKQLIIAFIIFSISQIALMLLLNLLGYNYFNSTNWYRWDSGHYISIVENGYEYFPCSGKFGFPDDSTAMCGNTGWFPGYPLLIKIFSPYFKDTLTAANVLSKIFYFLSLFMVAKIADINKISLKNMFFLSIPAFCFGNIYYSAIFPISAVIFFFLLAWYNFLKNHMWQTGLFCFLASFTYPTGFIISIVFSITIALRKNITIKEKISKLSIPVFMGVSGILLVCLIFKISVNDWAAFFKVQHKYNHALQNPILKIYSFFNWEELKNFSPKNFIQYQSFLVLSGYAITCLIFFKKYMFRNELYILTFIYITLFILFPWSVGGELSMYRAESLLFPFVFLLKEVRTLYIVSLSIGLLALGIPMSYLFFKGILI